MQTGYSVDTVKKLEAAFKDLKLHRPMRTERYEDGAELVYEVTGVDDNAEAVVRLKSNHLSAAALPDRYIRSRYWISYQTAVTQVPAEWAKAASMQ